MKQWLIFAVKAAVSGLLIWWLVNRIDVEPVLEVFGRVSAGPISLALAAMFLAAVLLALRWNAVNRALEIPLSRARALRLTLVGLFFNQTLPSTIGGDVARVWFVYREGVPVERAASGVISDRLFALASLLSIVAMSLPASFTMIDDPAARWSLPVLVAVGFGGFSVLLALGGRSGRYFERWAVTRSLLVLARDARRLIAFRTDLIVIFALAVAIHGLSVLTVWLIGKSMAADISLLDCLVFVPPVILISMAPISVAGWGIREGAMVVAFGFVGVPAAIALVVSLLFGLTLVVVGALGGLLWLSDRPDTRDGFGLAAAEEKSET